MKKLAFIVSLLIAVAASHGADVITLWNFNSSPADADLNTGLLAPSSGAGTVTLVGGITNGFVGGHTTDPANAGGDNTAMNTGNYPAPSTGNKTAGVRFSVSTVNYQNITLSLAIRVSNTGSRYYRVQYSSNGVDFVDTTNVLVVTSGGSYSTKTASFVGLPGVTNNPNFAFQILSEFDGTATNGPGSGNYVAANNGSSYGITGLTRFEMVTVSGDSFGPPNTPPSISNVTNVTTRMNLATPAVPVTIGDVETVATDLQIHGASGNQTLIPDANIVFGGSGSNRTVALTPAANQLGSGGITLWVVDGGGKSNTVSFTFNVLPTNTPPQVSAIAAQGTTVDTPTATIPFTIGDLDTAAVDLTVTGTSSNLTLLPNSGIGLGGSGSNRTVTLTPAAGQIGNAVVTMSVSDGVLSTNVSFVLSVLPSAGTLLYEPFNYADGSLITNSSFFWNNHSGTTGQISTASGGLYVSSDNSEDVNAPLRGQPFAPATGTNLYASFALTLQDLPTVIGDYFAHFRTTGGAFVGRIFVATTNAQGGTYRLGVANGTAGDASRPGYAEIPLDLPFNQSNRVTLRYNVGTGRATLWLNATSEADTSYSPTDVLGSTNAVAQFGFRETSFIGNLLVDDLRVATTFAEAQGILPPLAIRLRITRVGNDVFLAWPTSATGYSLITRDDVASGTWQPGPAPTVVGDDNVVTLTAPTGTAFYRLVK